MLLIYIVQKIKLKIHKMQDWKYVGVLALRQLSYQKQMYLNMETQS